MEIKCIKIKLICFLIYKRRKIAKNFSPWFLSTFCASSLRFNSLSWRMSAVSSSCDSLSKLGWAAKCCVIHSCRSSTSVTVYRKPCKETKHFSHSHHQIKPNSLLFPTRKRIRWAAMGWWCATCALTSWSADPGTGRTSCWAGPCGSNSWDISSSWFWCTRHSDIGSDGAFATLRCDPWRSLKPSRESPCPAKPCRGTFRLSW